MPGPYLSRTYWTSTGVKEDTSHNLWRTNVQTDYSPTGLAYPFAEMNLILSYLNYKNIYIKSDRGVMNNCWLVSITCANSRCIYLDLVPYCIAEACVSVLKRFVISLGAPKLIELDNKYRNLLLENLSIGRLIPKLHRGQGGFFERMIKSVTRKIKL